VLDPATLAVLILAGVAIGATGIGGVFAVPALTMLGGINAVTAVAASSFAFGANGAAAWMHRPGTDAPAHSLVPLLGGALVGAGMGAAVAAAVPGAWLQAGIASIALASGLHALLRVAAPDATRPLPGPRASMALGVVVGIGSALSGTGGPVLLLPALMMLKVDLSKAIAAAQAIQLPVAIAATVVHATAGRLDWPLGFATAAAIVVGWFGGRWLAGRLSLAWLRRLVALCLVATGLWYGLALMR